MTKNAPAASRDAGIELGRVFCCFCVIVIHVSSFYSEYKAASYIWTLAKCAATPVFFLITGFFFSADKPFKTYMSRLLYRVIIPTALVMMTIAQFTPWLSDQAPLSQCFTTLNTEYFIKVGQILVSFWPYDYLPDYNPFISIWFTFALIMCYLFFPIMKMICADNETARGVKKYLLWMGLFFFICRNSLLAFFPDNFTIQHLDWWIQEKPFYWLWLMLVGHELAIYLRNPQTADRLRPMLVPGGVAAYLIGGSILFWLTITFNVAENGGVNQRFFIREFVFYMLAQMGMFILFASLKINSRAISSLILFVADKTFYVYMIHEAVFKKMIKHTDFDVHTVSGYLGFVILAFLVSLAIACVLKKTERVITRSIINIRAGTRNPASDAA
ncbi:hypothetical protein C4J81_14985 [Deltaproteobacteria bacterium Smac51]|nr:hypothetical protein C4J81_14985 [Deltaproteobacteria bacterium Smac51]